MKNLPFAKQLSLGFILIGLIVSAILVEVITEVEVISSDAQKIEYLRIPTSQLSQKLEKGIQQSLVSLRDWVLLNDEKFKQKRRQTWDQDIYGTLTEMRAISKNWTNPENVERLNRIEKKIENFRRYQQEVEDIANTLDATPAQKILIEDADPKASEIIVSITEMINLEAAESATDDRKQLLKNMADFRGSFAVCKAEVKLFLLSGSLKNKENFHDQWEINEKSFKEIEEKKRLLNKEQLKSFKKLSQNRKSFEPLPKEMFEIRLSDQNNLANHWIRTKAAPEAQEILVDLRNMVENQKVLLHEDFIHHQSSIETLSRVTWILFVISVIFLFIIGYQIVRRVTVPIYQAIDMAREIGHGNVESASYLEGSREVVELSDALNKMSHQISSNLLTSQEAEAKYRELISAAVDPIISITDKGIVESVNSAFTKLFEYSSHEVVGKNINMIMPEPYHGEHDGYLEKYRRTGVKNIIGSGREVVGLKKSGQEFPLHLSVSEYAVGDKIYFTGIVRDLTEIKQAEAKYRELISAAVDPIISITDKGIVESVNLAFTKLFEYSFEEVIGKNINMIMPEPYHGEHDGYLEKYRRTGIKNIIGSGREVVGLKKSGQEFPLHLSVSEYKVGDQTYYTGIIRDLTIVKKLQSEQEKITADLQEKEIVQTFLSGFNETIRGNLEVKDLCKNIVDYLACEFGATVGSFYIAQGQGTLKAMAGFAIDEAQLTSQIELGSGIVGEVGLKKEPLLLKEVPSDYIKVSSSLGDKTPNHILVFPFLRSGDLKGVVELGTLKEFSQEQLKLIEISHDGVSISLEAAMARKATKELLEETQRQAEELQTQQEELAAKNEEMEEYTQQLKASEEELKSQSEELKTANEELEEKTEALEEQSQELKRKNIEINSAKRFVEDKARELELASKYKSEFLANMSHELRTPLNSSLLLAKKLLDNESGNLSENQVKSAQIIYEGGKDLLNLINDILDLSKVEAGRLDLDIKDVSLKEVTENITQIFEPVVQQKKIQFKTVVKPGLPETIKTDGLRLEQILKNFISNALKFTERGSVTFEITAPNPQIRFNKKGLKAQEAIAFSVIDTGIGIPQEKQRNIFEAFRQVDGSITRKYGGTGLGLTISREMASLLGGEIRLESEEGKGSTFTLYVPCELDSSKISEHSKESRVEPLQTVRHDDSISESSHQSFQTPALESNYLPDDRGVIKEHEKTLLVIEDDSEFAGILMEMAHTEGYKCLCAATGRDGLVLASEYNPNAILLDLGLPDIQGFKVLEELKHDLNTRHIPVHVISGLDKKVLSLQKGAFGYLEKPIEAEDLREVFSKIQNFNEPGEKKLLLIEDDKNSQMSIISLIEQGDLIIETAGSGSAGFEKLSQGAFDCVIVDLNLPDISGFELLKKCHESNLSMPPTIVYSGRDLSRTEYDELNKYAQSVVVKGAESPERLIDEVTLFLHSVERQLPESQKKVIRMLHKSDEVIRGKKILLVDDDMRNVFALTSVLEDQGMVVVAAENGEKALELLQKEENIDLILMDIMMPVMDGLEATKKIRKMSAFKKLPIIALTAKAMKGDRDQCLEVGANDYLTKPVPEEKLLSILRVWLFNGNGG